MFSSIYNYFTTSNQDKMTEIEELKEKIALLEIENNKLKENSFNNTIRFKTEKNKLVIYINILHSKISKIKHELIDEKLVTLKTIEELITEYDKKIYCQNLDTYVEELINKNNILESDLKELTNDYNQLKNQSEIKQNTLNKTLEKVMRENSSKIEKLTQNLNKTTTDLNKTKNILQEKIEEIKLIKTDTPKIDLYKLHDFIIKREKDNRNKFIKDEIFRKETTSKYVNKMRNKSSNKKEIIKTNIKIMVSYLDIINNDNYKINYIKDNEIYTANIKFTKLIGNKQTIKLVNNNKNKSIIIQKPEIIYDDNLKKDGNNYIQTVYLNETVEDIVILPPKYNSQSLYVKNNNYYKIELNYKTSINLFIYIQFK